MSRTSHSGPRSLIQPKGGPKRPIELKVSHFRAGKGAYSLPTHESQHRDGNIPPPRAAQTTRQACPAASTCPRLTKRWNPASLPASLSPATPHTPAPRGVPHAAPRPQHGPGAPRPHPPSSPWAPSWPGGSRKGSPAPLRTGLYPQISREQDGKLHYPATPSKHAGSGSTH